MKKIIYAVLATLSGVLLLLGYRTSHDVVVAAAVDSSTAVGTTGAPATAGSGSTTADAATTATATALTDGTYLGSATNTRYGPVQVRVTINGGVIADVQVPEYPNSNSKDRQINERALPTLMSETTAAQSADIDTVSGATYTSEGYLQSLQSALDQAAA
ncbi:FMN-binding protein [Planococcus sp. APC 4015]|nr:FMN-binding protein [Planococcus sp. APC 4015]